MKVLAFLSMLLLAACSNTAHINYVPGKVVSVHECSERCTIAVDFEDGYWGLGEIDTPQEVGNTVYKECYYSRQETLGCSFKFVAEKGN